MNQTVLIGGIQKFSTDDGPGIRTTVFIKGCPLNCKWCHNPELIDFNQQIIEMPNSCIKCGYCIKNCKEQAVFVDAEKKVKVNREKCTMCMECVDNCYAQGLKAVGKELTAEAVMKEVAKDKGFYNRTGGGLTISGGELLSHKDFALELVKLAQKEEINVCLDTSGCGKLEDLIELASYPNVTDILYDMKCVDSEKHVELTGLSNNVIPENLKKLAADEILRKKIHMRMPLIKGLNDSEEIIEKTKAFYKENNLKKVTLLPYHPLGVNKMKNIGGHQERYEAPNDERLVDIMNEFKSIGMDVEVSSFDKSKEKIAEENN
ncbi:MAG: glycyl-radical enzyme activating protein [Clostridia bacterium]|nr:glycyl-radical enzyme activating protein [Clostridia bacterium]